MAKAPKRVNLVPRAANLKKDSKGKEVAKLKQYLAKFGYLNPQKTAYEGLDMPPEPEETPVKGDKPFADVTSTTKDTFDDATAEALGAFQSFNGLEVTGELDKPTLELLKKKRCGFPDSPTIGTLGGSGAAEYSLHPNKWAKTNLTYGFLNYTPDLTPAQTRQAIDQAFALWAAETPLSFCRIANADAADIRIRFVTGDHGDGAPFDGAGGVLAHAFYPPPNAGALAGDAHFDDAETWTITLPTGSKYDLVTVAAHEFGHSLGLRHSSVSGALMYPYYGGPQRYLHSDDISGIRRHYGVFSLAHAMWLHGTDINIEYPDRLQAIRRAGFYTLIYGKTNTTNWFHFAIPSPVIVDNTRLRIARAILRCRTKSSNAIIRHVHLYDGWARIATHNNVNLTGNQWFAKFGVACKRHVYWGLGISIGVQFKGGTTGQRRMDFVGAGIDLIK